MTGPPKNIPSKHELTHFLLDVQKRHTSYDEFEKYVKITSSRTFL